MRKILVTVAILSLSAMASAAPRLSRRCGWTYQSMTLISADGENKAYFRADGEESKNEKATCCTIQSRLFVSKGKEAPFKVIQSEKSTDKYLAHEMRLVDWSPDNRWMLIERVQLSCNPLDSEPDVWIYDGSESALEVLEFPQIYDGHKAKQDCVIRVEALGFSVENQVVLRSYAASDLVSQNCSRDFTLGEEFLWLYEPVKQTLRKMPNLQVKAYGSRKLTQ